MNSLRLVYVPEDDWHGELTGYVQSQGFAGEGSAWFKIEDLNTFARRLTDYPLSEDRPPSIEGGYWGDDDRLAQTNLGVRLMPHDARGAVSVSVELREAGQVLPHAVSATFLVTYEDVGRFHRRFKAMLKTGNGEAVLEASAR